jgi:hypothetical protein
MLYVLSVLVGLLYFVLPGPGVQNIRDGCKTCPTRFVHAGWGVCFQI